MLMYMGFSLFLEINIKKTKIELFLSSNYIVLRETEKDSSYLPTPEG